MIGTLPNVLLRDVLWPPPSQEVPKLAIDKDLKFGDEVLFGPYRRRELTFKLKILGFALGEIHLYLQAGLRMQKKTCALLHLISASSSVPPVVVIELPR